MIGQTLAGRINFTNKVMGSMAALRLERYQVTQTLRSDSASIVAAILNKEVSAGDQLEVFLDDKLVGYVELFSMFAVSWNDLRWEDARRGGFDSLDNLASCLKRAGYRFKPLEDYELFRIQFGWREKRWE